MGNRRTCNGDVLQLTIVTGVDWKIVKMRPDPSLADVCEISPTDKKKVQPVMCQSSEEDANVWSIGEIEFSEIGSSCL